MTSWNYSSWKPNHFFPIIYKGDYKIKLSISFLFKWVHLRLLKVREICLCAFTLGPKNKKEKRGTEVQWGEGKNKKTEKKWYNIQKSTCL